MRDLITRNFFDLPNFFDNGFKNMDKLSKEYEKIINGKCDFEEDEEKYSIELEVPGVKKDEIEINLKDDLLTISWKRENEKKKKGGKSRYERLSGSFSRNFYVEYADIEKIEAELKNGVLKVLIPKLENYKPKKITIK